MYKKHYNRADAKMTAPSQPLLYVPTHTARDLDIDLKAAGIPKHTPEGKLDFHACRVAYINLLIESHVTVKEAQELARHASPELTMNVYGRARQDRLSNAVEEMASTLEADEKCAIVCYDQAVGAETESATPIKNKVLRSDEEWWRRRELNPRPKMVLP